MLSFSVVHGDFLPWGGLSLRQETPRRKGEGVRQVAEDGQGRLARSGLGTTEAIEYLDIGLSEHTGERQLAKGSGDEDVEDSVARRTTEPASPDNTGLRREAIAPGS